MNQRMRNRSRNAAVLLGQLVERRDGIGVTQNHGDLPAMRAQRRLTLRAGLGFGHSSPPCAKRCRASTAKYPAIGPASTVMSFERPEIGTERTIVNMPALTCVAMCGSRWRAARVVSISVKPVGLATMRATSAEYSVCDMAAISSGPIPPMNESYAVTSDVSTLISEVAA